MTLFRRIRFYAIGLLIGGAAAYAILGDRLTNGAWTPESKVKQRLRSTLLKASPKAQQELIVRNLQLADVRLAMPTADIDFGDTERGDDTIFYSVEAMLNGNSTTMVIMALRDFDTDSTATLWGFGTP
ncbi:MAG: hypothetical protein KBA60_13370 [Flavobacteriales bacterium]|nr:hypothetical protein [Flavobacteriales bacterium]MBP7156997.1 hypothetical protein [Flavobacteriales bacterium]HQV75931.1 hypothetical protein [Flavobacteriales bacterium]HQW41654.1 hypothetical protein [Flavobacteriales bacterium]